MEAGIVLNDSNEVIFRMEKHFSHHRRRILQDASSVSICTMHKKKVSEHGRWEVYKGHESEDTSKLSFIVKRPKMFTTEKNIVLHVFLPNNPEKSVCKVQASLKKNSYEIYGGGSTLAKANGIMENTDAMEVEIKASIDLAFIVALLMIVDEKMNNKVKKVARRTAKDMFGVVDAVSLGLEQAKLGIQEEMSELQELAEVIAEST